MSLAVRVSIDRNQMSKNLLGSTRKLRPGAQTNSRRGRFLIQRNAKCCADGDGGDCWTL